MPYKVIPRYGIGAWAFLLVRNVLQPVDPAARSQPWASKFEIKGERVA